MRRYYCAGTSAGPARAPAWQASNVPSPVLSTSNMKKYAILVFLVTLFATSGCVYRQTISQGNLIKQDDLDQVEEGMTRNQVRFLLGTPLIDDPFHADRWDYVYYLKVGRDDAGFKRWVSIIFDEDKVSDIRKNQELDPNL